MDLDELKLHLERFLVTHEVDDILSTLNKAIMARGDKSGLTGDDVKPYIFSAYCTDCGSGENVEIS